MIVIKNYRYTVSGPAARGTKVTVKNSDDVAHTVTASDGKSFNVTVPAGKTVTFTAPQKPGSYWFVCNFHSNMHGRLTVK